MPFISAADMGQSRRMAARPANDSLIVGTERKSVDPVNRKRPVVGSSSTAILTARTRRSPPSWISSMTIGCD